MSCQPKKIPRPILHGYGMRQYKQNIIMAVACGIAVGFLAFLKNMNTKHLYAEYHRTTDPYEVFEKMRATGVLRSCPPDPHYDDEK